MSKSNVKEFMNKYTDVTVNRDFVRRVVEYQNRFIRKNEDTINFLGGNLIGVYSFKYLEEDRLEWIEDILRIDDIDGLKNEVHNNTKINKEFFVSSDITNLSLVWVAHRALVDKGLSENERDKLARAAIDMLQYKFLSSIHTRFFKYAANEGLAKATYESLDKKSGLKKYGTWKGLLDSRTDDILASNSIWFKTLRNFDNDIEIIKMLNDIQGRLKAIMKKLTDTFNRLLEMDAKIHSSGKFVVVEGEELLKDYHSRYEKVRNRIHEVVPFRNDFVNDSIMEAVMKTHTTVNKHHLENTLFYISDNYNSKEGIIIKQLIDDIIIFAFDVIRQEKISLDHIPTAMIKLRNLFKSSRALDPNLISVRDRMGKLIEKGINIHNTSTVASTKIGVILYITLRGLVEK